MISSALADVSQASCSSSCTCGFSVAQSIARGLELRASHIARAVQELPLQVRDVDDVVVNEPKRSDTRGSEVQRGR